ncbi:hypothetical protein J7T55_004502 [Diaporthe amygdali]|uniref:uncharacterized protein n=1 Tax=Phomopsis amygdali TaxID=1214568 RepID=UPI0022FE39B6|nr:uncharacterized protein J7T55_004502 [Diaporthe amygdali]KAJ0114761.1 hypothetical protein J7T55_004502 [Diaporthe amygdali]
MTSQWDRSGGMVEVRPSTLDSDYFDRDPTSMASIDPCFEAFDERYVTSMFANSGNYDTIFQSDAWPTETIAGPDTHRANSPTVPPYNIPIPFPTTSNEIVPVAPTAWSTEDPPLSQRSPGVPWWSQTVTRSNNNPTSADGWEAGIPNNQVHNTALKLFPSSTADLNYSDSGRGSPRYDLSRKRRKSNAAGPNKEKRSESKRLGLAVASTYSIDPPKTPVSATSEISLEPPGTEARPNPRRSGSSRTGSPSHEAQSQSQSRPAIQHEQRARNRNAAVKCRAKTKAAATSLEATERAESLRHQQLSATFRGLQAEVFVLKTELLQHGNCEDHVIQDYLKNTAMSLTISGGGPGDGLPFINSRFA